MRDSLPSARYSPICNVLRQWKPRSSLFIESTDSIYKCPSSIRPASNLVPRRDPLNSQRVIVGPASNDSKVNYIASKTATLVSRFS